MASIDTGARPGQKRDLNREVPLIPFIDFLLCLVSFLLITAVWSQSARLQADARVPGQDRCGGDCKDVQPKRLHVEVRDRKFSLAWKQGSTVLSTAEIERKPTRVDDTTVRYPELQQRLAEEWKNQGVHRDLSDLQADEAVVHTGNTTEFGDLVAVMDAIHAQRRPQSLGGSTRDVPAFRVTFAAN